MIERKTIDFAEFKVSEETGEFTGYGSTFGNIDAGNDIVEAGAFSETIDDFLRDGFIGWNHDWGQPVAFPTKAAEDAKGLLLGAQFHSTDEGQRARTIAAERMKAGKSMGLSIGYGVAPGDSEVDDNGVRHIKRATLFEVSLVTVPMNRLAEVSAVKSLPYADEGEQLIESVLAYIDRSRDVARPRKEGRVLSAGNRARLESLLEALAGTASELSDLLASTEPEKARIERLIAIERERARFVGVPLSS